MNGPTNDGKVSAELLGHLLDEHGPALALYASQWTDAADDCVQEALVELSRQPALPEYFVAWLYRVVKNRALNAARGARRRRDREARFAESRLHASGADATSMLNAMMVSEALEQLAANEREAVVMRIWGGLTFEEVGRALSVATSTAHRIYQQAVTQLREHLETPCPKNDDLTMPPTARFPRN